MTSTTVYFAPNRRPDLNAPGGYGADMIGAGDRATYAVVPVAGIDLNDEDSGVLGTITEATPGQFAETVVAEIAASRRNLLVFIHGFDNSFEEAIKRAAFNREWFAASGLPAANTTVLAFTWPSAGTLFDNLPNPPDKAYKEDQRQAGLSGTHVAAFLRVVQPVAAQVRHAGGRVFLLAHSMGNHALSRAVATLFAGPGAPTSPVFDEAILAAADEVDTTLETAEANMFRLRSMATRISVYSSVRDVAMGLSIGVNGNIRLGYTGPAGRTNGTIYPPEQFRSVDCTGVFDFPGLVPPDATHQYYRRSKAVRADITALMAGKPVTPGVSALRALPFGGA